MPVLDCSLFSDLGHPTYATRAGGLHEMGLDRQRLGLWLQLGKLLQDKKGP